MKKKKIILIIVIVIGLFCTSLLTFSFAKYAKNSFWDYYLKSQEFYLSSDDLVSENIVNRIWDGSKVYFNVKNSLNNELITDYDINYDVVCKVLNSDVETDCYINGTNSDTYSGVLSSNSFCVNDTGDNVDVNGYNKSDCEVGGYTWKNQEAVKNLYFELSNAEVTNAEVEIILTSTSPYSKELVGTFKLNKDENSGKEIDFKINEFLGYSKLYLNSYVDEDKQVTIKWDSSKIRIDINLDEVVSYNVDSNNYINEIVVILTSQGQLYFDFYPVNNVKIGIDDFNISW